MIVRRLGDIVGTERDVSGEGWTSRRLLLGGDRMGFSLHDTLIHPGTPIHMEYRNHLEAVYCVEGRGTLTVVRTGEKITVAPGTVYALNLHDKHVLEAETTMRMVCVFNPPVTGTEVHDETGAYPLVEAETARTS